ncbi:thioredoxin family protein [Sporosarcina cyprini]|uniref:thioredoxin family protein n=1 Tax=Sporosarcina cyprini TaxID=2910523 RepID=UPI001EDEADBC|nr:thioredoxin domain-containing protein [Sporosarcina cyprini]MCG3087946.1 thioredoxin [Sporosarcina cyprini]
MASVMNVTKENFENEVLACDRPVLVDFYADGCGPCEFIAPILEELAEDHGDQIKFTKFYVTMDDVLHNSNEIVEKYEVMGFPTLLLFKGGEVAQSNLGAMNREELLAFVEAAL